ncbi:MAG: NAD(P)H-dependent oxidoreductase [Chthoniobacter sp.]|uniref:NADPH-dependent FMN reductase n=1 Tax=Chthoniobacter sp. TaxID=2510640 RepID=UPI0032A90F5B
MPAEYLIISASLRPASVSRLMGLYLTKELGGEHLDLREFSLPMCDGDAAYDDPNVEKLRERIAAARVLLLAVPIYNFDANAAVKNLVELTGGAWEDKIVGFACAAGGMSSYMSIIGLANSLMLDFRCIILPRFVYATGDDFEGGRITNADIKKRLTQLADSARRLRIEK